jgi:cell shape-determining protein MreC
MTYLERRKGHRGRNIFLSILAIILVIVVAVQSFAPQFFPALFTSLAAPFWRAEFSIESGSLNSPAALLRENQALKEELAADLARTSSQNYVDFENNELRSLLNKASSSPMVLAAVLKRPPQSAYDELIIDAGRAERLSSTSVIFASGDIPIGRVAELFDETSKIVLFSSPGQKIDVMIGESHVPATANGRGGGSYEAELPRGVKVSEGDFVLAASLDAKPIGKVVSIDTDPALPFQKILFAAPVNIYQLRWVMAEVGRRK